MGCAGSPLGLFLALRKVDPSKGRGLGTRAAAALMPGAAPADGLGDGLPAVRRLYNLYHPFDPVGYRCTIPFDLHCSRACTAQPSIDLHVPQEKDDSSDDLFLPSHNASYSIVWPHPEWPCAYQMKFA